MELSNYDLFEELFNFIKRGSSIKEVLKEFGGSCFYVPSHKNIFRNKEIIEDYKNGMSVKKISREYDLSEARVYSLTKHLREEVDMKK